MHKNGWYRLIDRCEEVVEAPIAAPSSLGWIDRGPFQLIERG